MPGTVVFNNAAAGVVGGYATLTARTYTEGDIVGLTKAQAGASDWSIQSNGTLLFWGPGSINTNMPITNAGGLLRLAGQVRASLSGGGVGAGLFDYIQSTAGSNLQIENGSVLFLQNKMTMSNGTLTLVMNANLPANQQTATISGKFIMSGGDILFSSPIQIGTGLVYGTFTVNGDVDWTGGRYIPCVDPAQAGVASKWIVNGTLTVGGTAQVAPNYPAGQNPVASSNWTIIDSSAANIAFLSLPAGSPFTLSISTVGGRKLIKLLS